jgi:hypothetical protein
MESGTNIIQVEPHDLLAEPDAGDLSECDILVQGADLDSQELRGSCFAD